MEIIPGYEKPNVLIVDDDISQLEYLDILISPLEANTISAFSGPDALEKAAGIDFALAIIDVRMPIMNGYELAMKLGENRGKEIIPIIFLTAESSLGNHVIAGYNAGAVDYIAKPISKQILISKIKIFLSLFNQKKTIKRQFSELKKITSDLAFMNKTLAANEEKYRNITNFAPTGIFVADETGRYREVNPTACKITGYQADELLNMKITDLLPPDSLKAGLLHFQKTITDGGAQFEIKYQHKSKGIRWWSVDSVKITPHRLMAFVQDITERHEAENQLREISDKYQSLFENSLIGTGLAEPDGTIIQYNQAFADLLEFPFDELKYKNAGDLYLDKTLRDETISQLLKNNTLKNHELVLITKNGKQINVLTNISLIKINGKPFLQTACLDITQLKKITEDLKHHVLYEHAAAECTRILATSDDLDSTINEVFRILLECTDSDIIYIFKNSMHDDLGLCASLKYEVCAENIISFLHNPRFQKLPYSSFGTDFINCMHNNEPFSAFTDRNQEYLKNILLERDEISLLILPIYSGKIFWGFIGFNDFKNERKWSQNEINLLKIVSQTIGATLQRRQIAEELRKSEELFRSVVFNSADLTVLTNQEGTIVFISPQSESVLGYSPEIFIDKLKPKIVHPDDVDRCRKIWEKVFYEQYELKDFEYRIIDNDGIIRWISHSTKPVSVNQTNLGIQHTIRNITERKNSEQALRVSEEKYRTMLNASPDGIFITNLKGIITDVSEIGLELYGSDNRNDLMGKHFMRFLPGDEKKVVKEIIEKTLTEGLAQNVEIKIRKKNQSLFLSETSATLIQDSDGVPVSFMVIIRDISQRKRIEKKQIHADRMASLGEMASGIAHEINQPLNTISLALDNIVFETNNKEGIDKNYLKKKTDKIFENISRIRNIIDHVRSFSSSNDDYVLSGFDINTSIRNAVSMVSEQFKHKAIQLHLKLKNNLPTIVGNTYKFEQVILNLLSNAKDAVLERKTQSNSALEMKISITSYIENQCIGVEITDNGTGISEDDIDHIMLPFYTTKDAGKGTGLGLSISYQIIKEMNGSIEITSTPEQGTTFKIWLKIKT